MKNQRADIRKLPPGRNSALERLIAEGRVEPARLDLTELSPPPERFQEISISEALAEQRAERNLNGQDAVPGPNPPGPGLSRKLPSR